MFAGDHNGGHQCQRSFRGRILELRWLNQFFLRIIFGGQRSCKSQTLNLGWRDPSPMGIIMKVTIFEVNVIQRSNSQTWVMGSVFAVDRNGGH